MPQSDAYYTRLRDETASRLLVQTTIEKHITKRNDLLSASYDAINAADIFIKALKIQHKKEQLTNIIDEVKT